MYKVIWQEAILLSWRPSRHWMHLSVTCAVQAHSPAVGMLSLAGTCPPQKGPFSCGKSAPYLICGSLDPHKSASQRKYESVRLFMYSSSVSWTHRQTDRQTDTRYGVTYRLHLYTVCMRRGLKNKKPISTENLFWVLVHGDVLETSNIHVRSEYHLQHSNSLHHPHDFMSLSSPSFHGLLCSS